MLLKFTFYLSLLTLLLASCKKENDQPPKRKVVIGYVGGFRGEVDEKAIDAKKLTHINYAFVDVKDSMAWLTNRATDTINFRKLARLKKDNPDLKILISIGGWAWSENFSDAVLTESSRKKFATSSTAIVEAHDLDGVDIDWEYPGLRGEDNVFRPEDKQHFTLMFKAIREALDELSKKTGKTYLLTTAIPCFAKFFEVTEMGKAQEYLDYVNLMAYDFYVSGDTAGHHSNLFASENDAKELSADKAVRTLIKEGVPAEKLVLGVPFYGRSWFMKSADNRGINRPVDSVTQGGGYTFIRDSIMLRPGFTRYWDEHAKAPYLFHDKTNQLVSYDDEQSLQNKCAYVKERSLAGIMFWEYSSDPQGYLLNTIDESFNPQ
jgi:chitinase